MRHILASLALIVSLLALSACGGGSMLPKGEAKYPTGMERTANDGNDI